MSDLAERQAFEAWAKPHLALNRNYEDDYANFSTEAAWLAWQAALREKDAEIERLKAAGEMLAAVTQGAMEEFVRVPYGASHEDVAAINDWHKMAAEAMAEWMSI